MKYFLIFFSIFGFCNCTETNLYEFSIENHLINKIVKIVPTSISDIWISQDDYYIVYPHEKIIIGSKIIFDGRLTAKDLYKTDDIIVPFDLYVDNKKQEKTLSCRKYWNFTLGKVAFSGKYTLFINDHILND